MALTLSISRSHHQQEEEEEEEEDDDDDEGVMDVPTCFHPSPLAAHRQASLDMEEGGRSLSMTWGEGGEGGEDMHMRTLRLTQHLNLDDGSSSSSSSNDKAMVSKRPELRVLGMNGGTLPL